MSNSKLLITGASGFIGSHIVERALALGYEVWAAVRSTSSRQWLTDARINFIELNLGDRDTLRRQLSAAGRFDYIVHAAGATKCLRREDFLRTNLDGTRNLVEVLRELDMLPERLVFVSSLSSFGAIREDEPHTDILDTDTPRPNTAYGESKLLAEQYLSTVPGLRYVVLRPTGVYGPRERDYFIMARSIKRHVDFAVGFRRQHITFVYVADLCQAVLRALTAQGVEGMAFLISDGQTYESRTFSDLLQSELGTRRLLRITAPLWFLRAVCAVNGAVCHAFGKLTTLNMDKYHILSQRNWQCDITPARERLGYSPEWPLERGVHETVRWYRENNWL